MTPDSPPGAGVGGRVGDTTVVVTVADREDPRACLSSTGLREALGLADVVLVARAAAEAAAARVGARYVRAGRPGRAALRNTGLAAAETPLVAFVDGACAPRAGWLPALVAGLGPHAAVIGRTATAATVALDETGDDTGDYVGDDTGARRLGPPVAPLGGSALYDRRLLREVGAFRPQVRYWDDLYLTARLLGYGCSVGYAEGAVVDAPDAWRSVLAWHRYGYWMEDLRRSGQLRRARVHARPRHSGAALALGRLGRAVCAPPRPQRRLPVRTRMPPDGPTPCVHLTIDDGPSPNTLELLRILQRYGAQADFFVVGAQVREHPELIDHIVRAGSAVHSHTMNHRQLDALGTDDIVDELAQAWHFIAAHAPEGPPRVRLPFGAGADDPYVHDAVRRWRQDCELVQWHIDTFDYKAWPQCADPAEVDRAAAAAAVSVLGAPDLAGSIVLMHECAFGAPDPLAERFSRVLLERLLVGLTARNVGTLLLSEVGRQGVRVRRR